MNKINKLIHCNPVVAMPKEVIRRKNMILLVEIISTGILDILSFSIKGAQYAITAKITGSNAAPGLRNYEDDEKKA